MNDMDKRYELRDEACKKLKELMNIESPSIGCINMLGDEVLKNILKLSDKEKVVYAKSLFNFLLENEYQMFTNLTAIYDKDKELEYLSLGLGSEVGEVLGKVKKVIRDNNGILDEERRKLIIDELGDVLWYISQLLNYMGCTFKKCMNMNAEKLLSRKARCCIEGDGDTR